MSQSLNNNHGVSLIELLIASAITIIGIAGALQFFLHIEKQKQNVQLQENLMEFRIKAINTLHNSLAIDKTVNHALNDGAFKCITDSDDCSGMDQRFSLIGSDDDIIYESKSTAGLSSDGRQCDNYGNSDNCSIQLDLRWKPVCYDVACLNPLVRVTGAFTKSDSQKTKSINVAKYNFMVDVQTLTAPVEIKIVDISVHYNTTYLVTSNGELISFGRNGDQDLGRSFAGPFDGQPGYVLDAGSNRETGVGKLTQNCSSHICFKTSVTEQVKCFGGNKHAEIGNNTVGGSVGHPATVSYWNSITSLIEPLTNVENLYCASGSFSGARLNDGRYVGWGHALGDRHATSVANTAPIGGTNADGDYYSVAVEANQIAFSADIIDKAFGTHHACAIIQPDREVVCWGNNSNNQFGHNPSAGTAGELNQPGGWYQVPNVPPANNRDVIFPPSNANDRKVRVAGVILKGVEKLIGKSFQTCAILDASQNNRLACWGGTLHAQARLVETSGGPIENIESAQAASNFGCALNKSGEVYCWGQNDLGQLGRGTTGAWQGLASPILWSGASVSQISLSHHACARLTDNSVICWGKNHVGQLGRGSGSESASSGTPQLVDLSGVL